MDNLNSTDTLEWRYILEDLSKKASSDIGKEYCLNLPFAKHYDEALMLQKQTEEALHLINSEGSIPIGGLRDIRKALNDLSIGAVLQGATFLDISSTLKCVRNLKRFIEAKSQPENELYQIIFPLYTNHDLEIKIESTFASDGSVLDTASSELSRIRSTTKQIQQNIREKLIRMIQDSKYKNVIQESLITQRSGRYVIPVKSEAQSQIKGIVQDQSQSGSTVYLEPMAVVDDNNKLAKKILEEKVEIERILRALGELIAPDAYQIKDTVETMAIIDSIIAKANYCISINGRKPYLNDKGLVDLHKVKHPILISRKGYDNVISIDVLLGKSFDTMIITGSNTGGKTVSLKTLGLCALMVKSGLYLPTKTESDMAFFGKVLADIGDEQSLEQNLSTFSGHLTNINKILKAADNTSLVLFDEIGTGTDPAEGAAIAQAIIEDLRNKGAKLVVTTHYGELKTLAYNYQGISNASVEFNIETLSPTYRLLLGVPGKSNAVHIARRLGVDESVVERASELLKGEQLDITISIEKLESEYKRLLEERNKMEALNISLKEKEELYESELIELESKKKKVRQQLFEKFEAELSDATLEIKEIVKDLQMDKNSQNAEKARKEVQDVAERLKNRHKKDLESKIPKKDNIEILEGEYYYLPKIRQVVQVIELKDKKAEVQAGLLKLTINISDLSKVEGKELKNQVKALKNRGNSTKIKKDNTKQIKNSNDEYRSHFNECDLRGLYVDDALDKVSKFIDESNLLGASPLYIIHGKGTGALREAVRDYLKRTSFVEHFRTGDLHEGGEGISVVYLRK